MYKKAVVFGLRCWAKYKSKSVYPDQIEVDFENLLGAPKKLKIAVIDDAEFPWKDALEVKGHSVDVFEDYTKSIKQEGQRVKAYTFSKYDIVLCDIDGVGMMLYPGAEGVAVISDIREKNPMQVIAAFTGKPAKLLDPSTGRNITAIDKTFQRDWSVDDFLFNFSKLSCIFHKPSERWEFIRERLLHVGVSESKISEMQRTFVENVLLTKLLREKFSWSQADIKRIALESERQVDPVILAKIGVSSGKLIYSLLSFHVAERN